MILAGTVASSGGISAIKPPNLSVFVLGGGQSGNYLAGGNSGFFNSTPMVGQAEGTSYTVTVGGAGSNSSITSAGISRVSDSIGGSPGSALSTYFSFTPDYCLNVQRSFTMGGGGAGVQGSGGSAYLNGSSGLSFGWGSGNGGAGYFVPSALGLGSPIGRGGGGWLDPTIGYFQEYCYYGMTLTYYGVQGTPASSGAPNSGQGGVGVSPGNTSQGSSGVVIVSYPMQSSGITLLPLASHTGTMYEVSGTRYYVFRSTGSFTI